MRTIDETLAALSGLGLAGDDAARPQRTGPRPVDPAARTADAWADRAGELERKRAARKERKRLETLKARRKRKGKRKAPQSSGKGGYTGKSAIAGRGEAGRDFASHGASKRLFVDWLRTHPWSTQAEIKAGLDGVVPRGSIRAYCTNGQRQGYLEARQREMGRLYPGGPPRPVHEYRIMEGPAAEVRSCPLRRADFLG